MRTTICWQRVAGMRPASKISRNTSPYLVVMPPVFGGQRVPRGMSKPLDLPSAELGGDDKCGSAERLPKPVSTLARRCVERSSTK